MRTFYFIIFFCFIFTFHGQAQWDGNPASMYNPVATTPDNEQYAHTVTDGAGGIISVWSIRNFDNNRKGVYCQHTTADGVIAWGDSSAPVLLAHNFPAYSSVAVVDMQPDDSGGAYITWNMQTNDVAEVYLQHIDSNGASLFTNGGTRIIPVTGNFAYGGKISRDGADFYVCWSEQVQDADSLYPTYAEVMLQRYNKDGLPQWATGVAVSTVPSLRAVGELISDGNNGVFIAFLDTRNSNISTDGNFDNLDIYAQHISSTGQRLWGATDAVVFTGPYNQQTIDDGGSEIFSSMVTDGAGGFILVYYDYPGDNASKATLYAQRLGSNGTKIWAEGGVEIYSAFPSAYTKLTQVLSDGANGMVASWDVNYINGYGEVYVQRIDGGGNKAWGERGVKVNPTGQGGGFNDQSTLVADGTGQWVAAWSNRFEFAIKAQKINGAGQLQWDTSGVNICTNQFSVPSQPNLTKSNDNNVIAIWGDQRNSFIDNASDLYAAKIDGNGNLVQSGVYISVADGNWDNPATWQSNTVPPYGADVLVRHAVTCNADAACKSLRVEQPGSVTLLTGVNIIILQ